MLSSDKIKYILAWMEASWVLISVQAPSLRLKVENATSLAASALLSNKGKLCVILDLSASSFGYWPFLPVAVASFTPLLPWNHHNTF
jgi:hypothetical protein